MTRGPQRSARFRLPAGFRALPGGCPAPEGRCSVRLQRIASIWISFAGNVVGLLQRQQREVDACFAERQWSRDRRRRSDRRRESFPLSAGSGPVFHTFAAGFSPARLKMQPGWTEKIGWHLCSNFSAHRAAGACRWPSAARAIRKSRRWQWLGATARRRWLITGWRQRSVARAMSFPAGFLFMVVFDPNHCRGRSDGD